MHPARIALIEDNEIDVALYRFALDQQGEAYELEVLDNGDAALQFVSDHRLGKREPTPCVILVDLHLGVYDGMSIVRAIRDSPALEHIKVVVLTGIATPRQEAEIANLGALYRIKPLELESVIALAAEILDLCKKSFKAAV